MWFLFGFVTLGVGCLSSFLWRRLHSWRGEQGQVGGITYDFAISTHKQKYGRRRAVGAKVAVACSNDFNFSLRSEGEFDRVAKSIGLTRECQTGDADFDAAFYILSDDPVVHRLLQTDRELRAGIQKTFEDCRSGLGRPKALYVGRGRIWIDAKPNDDHVEVATADCRSVVPALSAVSARLVRGTSVKEDRDPFPLRAACILAVSTGLAINGGFEFSRILFGDFPRLGDAYAPVPLALLVGLTVILALAALALRLMGHSARTHLVLLELLLSGSFGAGITAYAELRDYNIEYDSSAIRIVPIHVAERYITHGRHNSTTYHIGLVDWPARLDPINITVSWEVYDRLSVGTVLLLEEHAGALGWVWAKGFQTQPE